MKVSTLKEVLALPFSIKKSFVPITEYIYVKENLIKATDLESYIEVRTEKEMPFQGCVLSEQLKTFLTSMDKEADLDFIVKENCLSILYNKRNSFSIPMESLDNFPESPSLKYTENSFVTRLMITEELLSSFERANKFASDTDITFNRLFLKENILFSSNRESIYKEKLNIENTSQAMIPKNLVKYLLKVKELFSTIEIHKHGFKLIGETATMYFPSFSDNTMPKFENVLTDLKDVLTIPLTEEFKDSINRISLFDTNTISISIKNNILNIHTDSIDESLELEKEIEKEISFKFNISYLKTLLNMGDSLVVKSKKDLENITGMGIDTDKYNILVAVVI